MPNAPAVIIVDPIFRGSRLMYAAHVAAALRTTGTNVSVLTRIEADTPLYQELFAAQPHRLHNVLPLPPAVWYTKLTRPLITAIWRELDRLIRAETPHAVIFAGWNEFFPRMTFFPQRDLAPLRNTACFAFDYSPHFWLREQTHTPWQRFQSTFKRALTHRWLRCLPRWNFFVADERLHDPRLSELCAPCRDRYRFLPEIAPDHCPATNLNDRHGPRELLLVGGQNRRKGLADILAAMRHPEFPNDLKIRLVGRLGDDLQPLRAELQSLPPTRFLWEETFLSDAAIRERYRQCDYVAIPYTRQFQATSSVLAWAAAHGKPVLATDHGLVGFRVRQHQLGVHYPSGDITALVNTLKSLPHRNTPEYQRWSHAGSGYAQSCRLELFQNGLRHAVLGT